MPRCMSLLVGTLRLFQPLRALHAAAAQLASWRLGVRGHARMPAAESPAAATAQPQRAAAHILHDVRTDERR